MLAMKSGLLAFVVVVGGCAVSPPMTDVLTEDDVRRVVGEALADRFPPPPPPGPSPNAGEPRGDELALDGNAAFDRYEAYALGGIVGAQTFEPVAEHRPFRAMAMPAPLDRNLEIHFIDVGQGDSTLLLCPNGNSILVDAGTLSGNDPEEIRDYIWERLGYDDPRLTTLIITHPDADHYNVLPRVLEAVPVESVFYSGALTNYQRPFQDWLSSLSAERTRVTAGYFDKPDVPNPDIDCGDVKLYILAANISSTFSSSNTKSIVLMVEYGSFKAVLTGDATKITEEKILERYGHDWLDVDMLKIGHHGSLATSTTEEWLSAVRPEYSVASAGLDNSHGHPRGEIFERIEPYAADWEGHHVRTAKGSRNDYIWTDSENYKKAIFSTATNGTIAAIIEPSGDFDLTWFHYGD